MRDLAVLVVNFNKRELLVKCLESIFASESTDFDVFLVDNASVDDSVDAVNKQFGEKVTLLLNEENTGGAGGFYRGMKYITELGKYKYLVEFDNDITVEPDAINALRHYMEHSPDVGACGATIIDANSPDYVYEMGAMIDVHTFRLNLPFHQAKQEKLPKESLCDYVAFGASIIRIEAMKRIGYADISFFIFWDDMEFCWRLRKAGYKVCAISSAVVYHNGQTAYHHPLGNYYRFRNKIVCFARHTSDEEFNVLPDTLLLIYFRNMVASINTPEKASAYTHALFDALNNVTGKVVDGKISTLYPHQKWHKMVAGKQCINICVSEGFTQLDSLIETLKNVTNAPIAINKEIKLGQELTVLACPYVLDFDYSSMLLDSECTLVWDNYHNFACDRGDFKAFNEYNDYYPLFKSALYMYVKAKLVELRKTYLKQKYLN